MKAKRNPRVHLICLPCCEGNLSHLKPHQHEADEPKCCWCGRLESDPKFRLSPAVVTRVVREACA